MYQWLSLQVKGSCCFEEDEFLAKIMTGAAAQAYTGVSYFFFASQAYVSWTYA